MDPRNSPQSDDNDFPTLEFYNQLRAVCDREPLVSTAINESKAVEDLQEITSGIAEEIGGDNATEILTQLATVGKIDNSDDETKANQTKVLAYLDIYFTNQKEFEDSLADEADEEEKQSPAKQQAKEIIKRKIKTTQDAATAFYQLIDEVFPANFDVAEVFKRAADTLATKEEAASVFISEGVSEQREEDNKILELYNTFVTTLAGQKALANTPSNTQFAIKALSEARQKVIEQFAIHQQRQQANHAAFLESKAEVDQDSQKRYPALALYNALQDHAGYVQLVYSAGNNVLALRELQHIKTDITASITGGNFGIEIDDENEAEDRVAKILALIASTPETDQETLGADEKRTLGYLRTYFKNEHIAPKASGLETPPDEETIEATLKLILTQPLLVDDHMRQSQQTPHEKILVKMLINTISAIKTPIDQYNSLIHHLFNDDASHPLLIDTESNTVLAAGTLQTMKNAMASALQMTATEIDTHIANLVDNKESKLGADAKQTFNALLQEHLTASLHTSLEIYNALQVRFFYNPLENTVENNDSASKALQYLHGEIAQDIGSDEGAADILDRAINSPNTLRNSEAGPNDEKALTLINNHFMMANRVGHDIESRPTLYTRVINMVVAQDKTVTPDDKIKLLRDLSRFVTQRQNNSVAALTQYFQSLDASLETLGKNIIKTIYALKLGDEEPELTHASSARLDAFDDTEETKLSAPASKSKKAAADDEDVDAEQRQAGKYQRQPKPSNKANKHARSASDDDEEQDESRLDYDVANRRKGEHISLADELAELDRQQKAQEAELAARREAEKQRKLEQSQKAWADKKRGLLPKFVAYAKSERTKKENAQNRQAERAAKAAAIEQARQQQEQARLQQEEMDQQQQQAEDARQEQELAEQQLAHEQQILLQQNDPMFNLIQHLRRGDAMPAGYLTKRAGETLDSLDVEEDEPPAAAVSAIQTPSQPELEDIFEEHKEESKSEFQFVRMNVVAPNAVVLSNAQAMQERMHEFAMQQSQNTPADARRKDAAARMLETVAFVFREKVELLLNVIQASQTIKETQRMHDIHNTLLLMLSESVQENRILNFEGLYKLQDEVIAKANKNVSVNKSIAKLNESETERKLEQPISVFCQIVVREEGDAAARNQANALQGKVKVILQAAKFSREKFIAAMHETITLADQLKPSAIDLAVQEFLPKLAVIYIDKNAANTVLMKANATLAALTQADPETVRVAQQGVLAATNLVKKANDAEENLKQAFLQFYSKFTKINNAEHHIVMTNAQIAQRSNDFLENFLSRINSSRLERMQHISIVILNNLEENYMQALKGIQIPDESNKDLRNQYDKCTLRKDLFNHYKNEISLLSTSLITAEDNEKKLYELLTEFLQNAGHQIVIDVDGNGLMQVEPSPIEDQRLRALTSMSGYLHILNRQKGQLTAQYAAELTPIIDAVQTSMQMMLVLDFKVQAHKDKLLALRDDLEKLAPLWERDVNRITDANRASLSRTVVAGTAASSATTQLRSPRSLSLHEEARRREANLVSQRQQVLADIFKSSSLPTNRK
jgi:hypothetical protein